MHIARRSKDPHRFLRLASIAAPDNYHRATITDHPSRALACTQPPSTLVSFVLFPWCSIIASSAPSSYEVRTPFVRQLESMRPGMGDGPPRFDGNWDLGAGKSAESTHRGSGLPGTCPLLSALRPPSPLFFPGLTPSLLPPASCLSAASLLAVSVLPPSPPSPPLSPPLSRHPIPPLH